MTEEENKTQNPASGAPDLGKFKDVDALMHAYRELEAEFTRRSQRLKALEEASRSDGTNAPPPAPDPAVGGSAADRPPAHAGQDPDSAALYAAVSENEEVRRRIVGEYLDSVRGVPLMTGGGAPVRAPSRHVSSISEAGALALSFLRNHKQ